MTTREICIAAKGTLNSTNNPASGVDVTGNDVTVYTVLSHPAPLPSPVPVITATRAVPVWILHGTRTPDFSLCKRPPTVTGPAAVWTDATAGNVAPPVSLPISAGNLYIRLVRNF